MTRLIAFVSTVLLLAFLPDVLAGPACSKKHYKNPDCLSKCRHGWGWSGNAMCTDRWGSVMEKMHPDETLDDVLHRACGFQSSSTGKQPLGNAETGSVDFSSTASSTVNSTQGTFHPTTFTSSVPRTSASSIHHSSSTSIKPFTSSRSTVQPSPPKTSSTPPSPSSTSSAHRITTSKTPASTSTSTGAAAPIMTAASSSNSSSSSDIATYLSAHNTVRAQHGAAPLTWSDDLASKAQTWADNCVFEHSGGSLGDFGENLAAGTGSSYGIQTAIKSWTDEVSEYDPENPTPSHFTQVVWKSTTQVGCAVQSCSGIFDPSFGKAKYYVCEYYPAGNIIGDFAANVQV